MAKMVKMARSEAEKKAEKADRDKRMEAYPSESDDGPEMSLDHHHMGKLGMDAPQVGDEVEMHVKGRVTHSSAHESDGHKTAHVRVQMTHIGVEKKPEPRSDKADIRKSLEAAAKKDD